MTAPIGSLPAVPEDPASREMRRLRDVAADFEEVMLGTLLREMRASSPWADDRADPGASALDSMGSEALAGAVVRGGGVGIAEVLVRTMEPQVRALAADHRGCEEARNGSGSDAVEDGGRTA
jgi:Rod binding domain-containing protein